MDKAYEAGLCLCAAAGNHFGITPPQTLVYPARFPRVIAVVGVMADGRPYADLKGTAMEGSFGRGYKGPGYSQFSLTSVHPEIPTHYEIGETAQFLDRRFTVNFSIFDTEFKNFQVESADPETLQFVVANAGKVSTRGADLQVVVVPVTGLKVSAGASYSNAHFVSFMGDQCYPGQAASQCPNGDTTDSSGRAPDSSQSRPAPPARR